MSSSKSLYTRKGEMQLNKKKRWCHLPVAGFICEKTKSIEEMMSELTTIKWKGIFLGSQSESHSVLCNSLQTDGLKPARFLCPCNSPGQSTGVGSQSLLQAILPTHGLNPGLLHCRWILYHLKYQKRLRKSKICQWESMKGHYRQR